MRAAICCNQQYKTDDKQSDGNTHQHGGSHHTPIQVEYEKRDDHADGQPVPNSADASFFHDTAPPIIPIRLTDTPLILYYSSIFPKWKGKNETWAFPADSRKPQR